MCEEMRYYLLIVFGSALLIAFNIRASFASFGKAFQQAIFQVASVISTTGFATADFNLWPEFSRMILVLLMFVGACAGSTGGGFKVSRLIIMVKSVRNEIMTVLCYLAGYVVILIVSVLLISLDNFDMTTNFTAVMATFNNVGPGLNRVGPTGNFGGFSVLSKLVLMFDMLVGRLELYPMLVIFAPGLWRIHPHRHVGKVQ